MGDGPGSRGGRSGTSADPPTCVRAQASLPGALGTLIAGHLSVADEVLGEVLGSLAERCCCPVPCPLLDAPQVGWWVGRGLQAVHGVI